MKPLWSYILLLISQVGSAVAIINSVEEFIMAGDRINFTCGYETCDRRSQFCLERIPGREDRKVCAPCHNKCGPGRILNNDRLEQECNQECTIYMLQLGLKKVDLQTIQIGCDTAQEHVLESRERSMDDLVTSVPSLKGSSGDSNPCPDHTLISWIVGGMFIVFVSIMLVLIYRKIKSPKFISQSSLESGATDATHCCYRKMFCHYSNLDQSAPGTPTPGQPAPGQLALGTPVPGPPAPGQLTPPGQPAPGQEAPGLPASGQEAPGLPAPGLPAPGLSAPGQQASGQLAPGQLAPGQPASQPSSSQRLSTPTLTLGRSSVAHNNSSQHMAASRGGSSRTPGTSTHSPGCSTSQVISNSSICNRQSGVQDSELNLNLNSDTDGGYDTSRIPEQPVSEAGVSGGPSPHDLHLPIQATGPSDVRYHRHIPVHGDPEERLEFSPEGRFSQPMRNGETDQLLSQETLPKHS